MFVKGGIIPVIGFHSTIESPLSVNLVRPPNTKIPKTNTAVPSNQYPTIGFVNLVVNIDDCDDVKFPPNEPFPKTDDFRKKFVNEDFDGIKNGFCLDNGKFVRKEFERV